ncbi:SAP domain-containing protein [Butyrivibrio sp. INlla14]|uniref:SAP domain-containing protein n=1 Tax=Butyrivibrio sp. INlla14 TaxID=1520808 RepID=UPI00087603E3|nr:SAP domain-containing protein [Butyrivibrio sp. INlla14]SCY63071.1 SAP domain-containing protein [Butyrivibrio sp. INlla14]
MFLENAEFTQDEKKILKAGIGTILWKIIFWPFLIFELLLFIGCSSDWASNIGVFIFCMIPFLVVAYFAFRKQWFWKEEKQREYIAKVKTRQARYRRSTVNPPPYKATPYATSDTVKEQKHPFVETAVETVQPMHDSKVEYDVTSDHTERADSDYEIPPLQGEYAKTIFLWAHDKPAPIKPASQYARYFLFECGIRDCNKYHKQLIDEGYFEEAAATDKLKMLTVADLKVMLKEKGQSVTGKKEELISRLIHSADSDYINSKIPEQIYKLSAKGEETLANNNHYVMLHKNKNWGITDWKEYDREAKSGEDFWDVMWRISNKKLDKAADWEKRNLFYCMYTILRGKGNMSDALEILLKVFYLDLNGTTSAKTFELYKESKVFTKDYLKDVFNAYVMIAPGLVKDLPDFKNVYDADMITVLYAWKLPMYICPKELFQQIIEAGINGTLDIEKALGLLQIEYNKMVDRL